MDEFYHNYRSAWRPLTRENELSATSTSSDNEAPTKTSERGETPTEVENILEQTEF